MADIGKTLRDAAYVVIGAGVLTYQKAQVRRRELEKQFESQATEAREQIAKLAKGVEERWEPVVKEIESRLDEIEQRLPEQAGKVMKQARTIAKDAQTELASRLTPSNGKAA